MPLCPPPVSRKLTWDRTDASATWGRRLTAWRNKAYPELHIKIQSVPRSKHSVSVIKTSRSVLYRKIIAICTQIHIKHINMLCGQNVELLMLNLVVYIRGDADKSLARPTSRCRRTESIVSLERGVCSCAELQVFSCYRGWKEACQATRAI